MRALLLTRSVCRLLRRSAPSPRTSCHFISYTSLTSSSISRNLSSQALLVSDSALSTVVENHEPRPEEVAQPSARSEPPRRESGPSGPDELRAAVDKLRRLYSTQHSSRQECTLNQFVTTADRFLHFAKDDTLDGVLPKDLRGLVFEVVCLGYRIVEEKNGRRFNILVEYSKAGRKDEALRLVGWMLSASVENPFSQKEKTLSLELVAPLVKKWVSSGLPDDIARLKSITTMLIKGEFIDADVFYQDDVRRELEFLRRVDPESTSGVVRMLLLVHLYSYFSSGLHGRTIRLMQTMSALRLDPPSELLQRTMQHFADRAENSQDDDASGPLRSAIRLLQRYQHIPVKDEVVLSDLFSRCLRVSKNPALTHDLYNIICSRGEHLLPALVYSYILLNVRTMNVARAVRAYHRVNETKAIHPSWLIATILRGLLLSRDTSKATSFVDSLPTIYLNEQRQGRGLQCALIAYATATKNRGLFERIRSVNRDCSLPVLRSVLRYHTVLGSQTAVRETIEEMLRLGYVVDDSSISILLRANLQVDFANVRRSVRRYETQMGPRSWFEVLRAAYGNEDEKVIQWAKGNLDLVFRSQRLHLEKERLQAERDEMCAGIKLPRIQKRIERLEASRTTVFNLDLKDYVRRQGVEAALSFFERHCYSPDTREGRVSIIPNQVSFRTLLHAARRVRNQDVEEWAMTEMRKRGFWTAGRPGSVPQYDPAQAAEEQWRSNLDLENCDAIADMVDAQASPKPKPQRTESSKRSENKIREMHVHRLLSRLEEDKIQRRQ
ncbi:hypothetical protein SAICODRAFT_26723 [Saitoella complicata NRRL Y-17804]|uniref:Uncharacterized protein n=1 Tax=Saitoella complicata (strain BCRC 22490 / CBS 7301 / JCM 7358 / NBRC 10748 / NRRL Y-17804) TaxID=698492 RepID=A0A0E9NDD0_SAICN|nr:uncharacterized protein SAICODRAFT_26723 [Saitoella complicata NRRL Y-17804]ODQ51645.1 hypothetical protein SAICODRAFT_26723 [Saitoella complicata NRRL Y-17804]GAO47395.1 hypothetical protein G7K_1603-t1 [Saitoella complicata NRRL Y-17804]